MRVFHKVMNKTWSSVPTQQGIEAEKSGAWRRMQEVKWCWHLTNTSNARMVHFEASHLLQAPPGNGRHCFLDIYNQLLNYDLGDGGKPKF